MPRLSTKIGVLQVPLRTTDPTHARIIARRLTAVSDRMFDDIRNEALSLSDAAKWLRHVVTDEMARIQRNRAIIFADGDPNPRADWAKAEALKILAKRGPCTALRQESRYPCCR